MLAILYFFAFAVSFASQASITEEDSVNRRIYFPDETLVNGNEIQANGDETWVNANETQVNGNETQVNANETWVNGNETRVNDDEIWVNNDETQVTGDDTWVNGDETRVNGNETWVNGDDTPVNANKTLVNHGYGTQLNGDEIQVNGDKIWVNNDEIWVNGYDTWVNADKTLVNHGYETQVKGLEDPCTIKGTILGTCGFRCDCFLFTLYNTSDIEYCAHYEDGQDVICCPNDEYRQILHFPYYTRNGVNQLSVNTHPDRGLRHKLVRDDTLKRPVSMRTDVSKGIIHVKYRGELLEGNLRQILRLEQLTKSCVRGSDTYQGCLLFAMMVFNDIDVNQTPEKRLIGTPCALSDGRPGTCGESCDCKDFIEANVGKGTIQQCGNWSTGNEGFLYCCPSEEYRIDRRKVLGARITEHEHEVVAPLLTYGNTNRGLTCGTIYNIEYRYGHIEGTQYSIYHLNKTMEHWESLGYNITVNKMLGDAVTNFTFTDDDGSNSTVVAFDRTSRWLPVVGGKPAPEQMAVFMALIGEQNKEGSNKTLWVCDGVLINTLWILSAAHCFSYPHITPNIIRLGDYDFSQEQEKNNTFPPFDVGIDYVVFYPEYVAEHQYHDIVLIRTERQYPMFATNINPACLPWGDGTNRDMVGENVTLSGWGTTQYDATSSEKTPILQAVDLEVYDVSVCNDSYSQLADYRFKWPRGMTSDTVLCSGWLPGGRDACKGDSGAPLTYLVESKLSHEVIYQSTVAGIVSSGFGCGLPEYPSIYIPLRKRYLSWIKTVAFKGYKDAVSRKAQESLTHTHPPLFHEVMERFFGIH